MEFLGDRRAADDGAPLDDAGGKPRRSELRRAHETVVTAADDDGVVARPSLRHYSASPAATCEKPQSTYVTSAVIAEDRDEK